MRGKTHKTEGYRARESYILSGRPDLSVGEEEDHRDESSNDHCSTTAPSRLAHRTSQDWAKDTAEVCQCVIAPSHELAAIPSRCSTSLQVRGKEHVVERICKAYKEPRKPDQAGRESDPLCYEEAS